MNTADSTLSLDRLSRHLFWDVDRNQLSPDLHSIIIISQVLKYGLIDDWRLIKSYYGLNKIIETAQKMKDLDKKTASYLSIIANIDKNGFLCYSRKQSQTPHWNF